MDKNKNSNLLVIDGGSVKTEENGIVSGLGIVFGSETEPDQSQERDFFTSDSYIMKKSSFTVPLFYNHGIGLINDQVGEATLVKTAIGWQATATIDTDDELGKKVYEAVKDKPHGFSTGALQHLVKREAKANNTNFLKKWVVGEISLTERPAERRAVVQSVKSVDGIPVFENAWEQDQPKFVISLLDADSNIIWDSNADVKSLQNLPAKAHSLTIKEVSGSINYSVYIMDEDDYSRGASISVYQWGGVEDFIGRIQAMVNTAAEAAIADASEDSSESSTLDSLGVSKSLEEKVASIVKNILAKDQVKVSELESQLQEKEGELVELRQSLAANEKALADLKREQYVEILAGADETIKNNKGK